MAGYFSPRWGKKETDHLETILYQYSLSEIVINMQMWQKKLNLPLRSTQAIRQKCYKLGRTSGLQEDNLSKAQLATMLDIPAHRVTSWINRYGLFCTQRYRNREVSIAIKDFKYWAANNLEYLHSIESFRLHYFLSDKLVQTIPRATPFYRPVKCINNGQTFDTIAAAARAIGVHKVTLARAVENNWQCKGYRWELIAQIPAQIKT